MINKQSLWFLTLFSLILVLSLYYITMPSEMLLTNNNVETKKSKQDNTKTTIKESEELVSLRVETDEKRSELMETYQATLADEKKSTEEKNSAYESLKELNVTQAKEDELEKKIKSSLKLNSFVKIDKDDIRVVIASSKHSVSLANDIMNLVQKEFETKKHISVQFQ